MSGTAPGRAAYEAFMRSLTGRCPDVPVVLWERLDDLAREGYASGDTQADWDAAAQAAIAAVIEQPVPVIVSIAGKLTELDAAQLRERLAEALKNPPQPAPELAAAMAETRKVADAANVVLDAFARGSDGYRARLSGVTLMRAYKAIGRPVPDRLKHLEGQ